MTNLPLKFDEIGAWSELKLEIIEKYGAAYVKVLSSTPNIKKYYIDGFSGAGIHIAKKTKAPVEGSPSRALKIQPPFDGYYLIELDEDKTDYLRATYAAAGPMFSFIPTIATTCLVKTLIPNIQYKKLQTSAVLA